MISEVWVHGPTGSAVSRRAQQHVERGVDGQQKSESLYTCPDLLPPFPKPTSYGWKFLE